MNSANFLAMAGAALLATTALSPIAQAQVVYNGNVVTANTPLVASTHGGHTHYQSGHKPVVNSYQKGTAHPGYVIAPKPTPVIPKVVTKSVFAEEKPVVVINKTPAYTAPTKENAVRLSLGYGFATPGTFSYGIASPYTADSAESTDWDDTVGEDYLDEPWLSENLRHQGFYGSLRADADNLFVDAAGGFYSIKDRALTSTFNVAQADANQSATSVLIGPSFWAVDGSDNSFDGSFTDAGDGIQGDEFDTLEVTATINSTIRDLGAAAGYLFNMQDVPMKVGVGVAAKSLSRTTVTEIEGEYTRVTTNETLNPVFDDHSYTEQVTGTYFGPALRVNYDPRLSQQIGAHFGGTMQALYGKANMALSQSVGDTTTYELEAKSKDGGILFAGELDAGLSFQASATTRIGLGVFAGLTSGAPVVTQVTDVDAATKDDRLPTLGRGTWTNYGLKGSISASF